MLEKHYSTLYIPKNVQFIWLISITFVLLASASTQKKSGKCAVFDAFKVLPENSTNFIGGAFALHKPDCHAIVGESVQEIVALQWIFSHWNGVQKAMSSQVGLFVGDSCSRPKESVLQTLRFLDFVNFYEPKECTKTKKNGSMVGILAPKDRQSSASIAGILQSTNLLVGAYTSESVEALLKGGVNRVLTTSVLIEDYISAFSALMISIESDLVIVVTCDEESSRLDLVLKLLNDQEIHVSEVIQSNHDLIVDVLKNTDSNVLLYLPCEKELQNNFEVREIDNGPKLLITIGINDGDTHFPYRIKDAQEIIIRQIRTELPLFRPYFLRILANNYDTYALASSYIQQLINCSFSQKTCPHINFESLNSVYVQGKNVDAIVRLAYAFVTASKFVDVDEKLKLVCKNSSVECVDGIFQQLSSMRFVNEKGPLELANEELGFFPKTKNVLQSIGLRLEAVLGGSEEIFKYLIAREPKLISKGLPASLRSIRSVCRPYHTYCGNCEQAILADPKTTFLNNQQVASFYLAGLFNLHAEGCENIRQESIIEAFAVTYTLNTITEKHPNLALRPLKDYGAILFDSCSDAYRARQFTINTETQCLKLPLSEFNISLPASTILGYISALDGPNQASLLRGMSVPAVTMNVDRQNGVIGLLASAKQIARAVANFLQSMQWDFVSIVVSSSDPRSMSNFEAFSDLTDEYGLCVENVLFYSALNRTRLNSHQSSTNVTLYFTTSGDAAEYFSTRFRFSVELSNNVDVMIGEAQDFLIHDSNMLQYSGTIAIRPKDILSTDFKDYLTNVTPLTFTDQWFWNYVENQWRCALSLQNKLKYDGRLCTGNEHLNLLDFGQLSEIGLLIRGTERLVFAMDRAYRKACGTESNIGFCEEFLVNGRRLIREELDAEKFDIEFQVDEFLPIDHHGNLGYKRIGNFTFDFKYIEIEEYRVFSSGIPKYEVEHKSSCSSSLCSCRQKIQNTKSLPISLNGKYGSIKWFHADNSPLFANWDASTINYVFIGITSTIICLSTGTLLLVLYKVYTRAIKGNQSLGIFSLIGIILMNLTAYLYILDSNDQIYEIRVLLNGLAHVICFGLVLIKAIRLRNFEDICNKRKLQIGWNYWMMLFFITSVQLAIYFHLDSTELREAFTQGYTSFLLLLALLINVQNRKILRNYKESKWLFLVNILALALYAGWAISRTLLLPVYVRHIDISELLLLSLILLVFLFGPKVYILLLYESVIVERCTTPAKPTIYEDDLFATGSPNLSSRSNLSRKESLTHRSVSTTVADEFPVLKTVMRKRDFVPSEKRLRLSHSSDRHSSASTSS